MNISTQSEFGSQIIDIWNDEVFNQIDIKHRGFAIQDILEQNSLMFIGINPSYNKVPGNIFYDNSHGQIHAYFKKFIEISHEVKLNWSHLDLLFVRETNQKLIKVLLDYPIGLEFVDRQLRISKRIIELAKPKIIVVNNTFARDLLHSDKFSTPSYDFEFDETIGTYRIINNESLNGTPVFFTSMLTGQRALDLGSYKRLIWHIKYVIKYIQ